MKGLGIWQIGDAAPTRAAEAEIDLERHLEDWIEADPSLLREGLVIVGRQVHVQSGPLDLLALDPQGRWVVIEIKRGALSEQAVTQVIDYAACLRDLSASEFRSRLEPYFAKHGGDLDTLLEERGAEDALEPEHRELLLFVVGTGKAGSLERMVRFLSEPYGLPISVILLQVFRLDDGRNLLVREVTEQETPHVDTRLTTDAVLKLADKYGTRAKLDRAMDVAGEKGLRVRPFQTCLMFAPPSNATRCLFTIWAKPDGGNLAAYVSTDAFAEFFPVERANVEKRLGTGGWRHLDEAGFETLLQGVKALDLGS